MDIDFKKVGQKKVREFLGKFGLASLSGFSAVRPICYDESSARSYRRHFESFLIAADIERVWNTYANIHPRDAWKGEMLGFGLQISRKNNRISYLQDPYTGLEKGQIIILNLSLLWGWLNVAVAHEVTEVNEAERTIKLCYLEGSASEGSQWISLKPTDEGFTEVSHLTFYKSKSSFRDKYLYPPLHSKAIREFHGNVKRMAEGK